MMIASDLIAHGGALPANITEVIFNIEANFILLLLLDHANQID